MVYLSLSVEDIDQSRIFYVDILQLFKVQSGNRLICNSGVDFILDLYQVGTAEHESVFGKPEQLKASFMLRFEDDSLPLLAELKANSVLYELNDNIAGSFLRLKDPSGNEITISHQNCGGIC